MAAITALVLLDLIAFWAIATGVVEILTAIRLRRPITNEWLLVISGIASVLFGVLLLVRPGAGSLTFGWLIGFSAILVGVLLVGLAFRLRSHANDQGLGGTA